MFQGCGKTTKDFLPNPNQKLKPITCHLVGERTGWRIIFPTPLPNIFKSVINQKFKINWNQHKERVLLPQKIQKHYVVSDVVMRANTKF
jgi:hypothetical protein